MRSVPTYRQQLLRMTIVIGLIFLIGLKVMAPVFKTTGVFIKEVIVSTESDAGKTQKGIDTDQYSKNKEYNISYLYDSDYQLWFTKITFFSAYSIDYKSSYYYKITIPPPESDLHSIV